MHEAAMCGGIGRLAVPPPQRGLRRREIRDPPSGGDFDAEERVPGRLVLEHGLHRGDRDGELGEVGLAGGEQLELEPGLHEDLHPAPAAVLAGELDELERDAGDQRHADDPA